MQEIADVDQLMSASKVITAVVAESMSKTRLALSAPQLRLLVVLEGGGEMNLSGLAARLSVDASTASRTCDQLVKAGLITRERGSEDRRQVTLGLSKRGASFVQRLMERRRQAFTQILERMSQPDRSRLTAGLSALGLAAEHVEAPAAGGPMAES